MRGSKIIAQRTAEAVAFAELVRKPAEQRRAEIATRPRDLEAYELAELKCWNSATISANAS